MPGCSSAEPSRPVRPRGLRTSTALAPPRGGLLLALLALLAGLLPGVACAGSILVEQAEGRMVNDIYVVDARLAYDLGREAREALDNGIALYLVVEVELEQAREYLWDERVVRVRQRYRLEQHALSGQYSVTNTATRARSTHPDIDEALAALGTVENMPVVERSRLVPGARYTARLRAYLDVYRLPGLLRALAAVMPAWQLSSDWREWEVVP